MKMIFSFFKTINVHDSMSHVSLLSDQFCIYMLKLRLLIERKPNYRRDPLPVGSLTYPKERILWSCWLFYTVAFLGDGFFLGTPDLPLRSYIQGISENFTGVLKFGCRITFYSIYLSKSFRKSGLISLSIHAEKYSCYVWILLQI